MSEIVVGLYEGHPLKRKGQKAFVFYEFVKKEIKTEMSDLVFPAL